MISSNKKHLQLMLVPFIVSTSWAFQACPSRRPSFTLNVHQVRDADMYELMVGGERYEMLPLPDSMMDTTLFVGNLNEFVRDEDLSEFFKAVSTYSVPACVARKANMNSLHYGFVTFPSAQEKEAAILRFHGTTFMGQDMKVEPIRDHPTKGRVRVPGRLVEYVSGAAKKTRDGRTNTMRRVARVEEAEKKKKQRIKAVNKKKKMDRRKKQKKLQPFKLNETEEKEFERSYRRGYVTLDGTGYRRGRKTSSLACAHRQYCDQREKPHIVLCKASGGRPLDCVIVDLSPLRTTSAVGANDFLVKWKTQILTAATNADMELRTDYLEDNCLTLSTEGEGIELNEGQSEDSWATKPISKLPVLSLGVFEGERSKAKAMARELALLWEIPEEPPASNDSSSDGIKNKARKSKHKKDATPRRRRNNAQDLFLMCQN